MPDEGWHHLISEMNVEHYYLKLLILKHYHLNFESDLLNLQTRLGFRSSSNEETPTSCDECRLTPSLTI